MRLFIIIAMLAINVVAISAQQIKKATIMIVPDEKWCINNKIMDEAGNPDYRKAILDQKMDALISTLGGILEMRGYDKPKRLDECIKALDEEQGYDMVLQSKGDGEIVETDLDKLTRTAKADILIKLSYDLEEYGSRHIVNYNVIGVDAATSKQIGGIPGRTPMSSAPVTSLFNEAVYGLMDSFCGSLDRHYNDMFTSGREGVVIFKMADDCEYTFESEVSLNGETGELSEVIEYWLNENAVNGAFNESGRARNRLAFEQVRFPMFGESKFGGRPKSLDIQGFMRPIEKFLSQFGISCSFQPIGIGKVYIVLGSK